MLKQLMDYKSEYKSAKTDQDKQIIHQKVAKFTKKWLDSKNIQLASQIEFKSPAELLLLDKQFIEKKVKRKYPGIRSSFVKSYQALFDKDFFGIKGRDLNSLSFIDRLNLHTKSSGTTKVEFTNEEMKLVKQVEACETWEDVIRVTKAVFNYSKDEQFEMLQQLLASMDYQQDSYLT